MGTLASYNTTISVIKTSSFTASSGIAYPIDTRAFPLTVTFPLTPSINDKIVLIDYAGSWGTNIVTVNPNGNNINGSNVNILLSSPREAVTFTYIDSTQGWLATGQANETVINDASSTIKGIVQLSGELGGTASSPTLSNDAVISKLLTGYSSAAGTILPTDSVLQGLQKLDGNYQDTKITIGAIQTTNFIAVSNYFYPVDTTSNTVTVTLPLTPIVNKTVDLIDYAGTWGTNNVTINPNGSKINGSTSNRLITLNRASITLRYIDSTQGWEIVNLFSLPNANGQLLIGDANGNWKLGTLTAGSNITITNTANGISIASSGGGGGTSLTITYQANSTTLPTTTNVGDQVIVTSDGLYTGTLKEEWIYTSSGWYQLSGTAPVSGAIIDNTITDSASITVIGRYIVPASGTANEFIGYENYYADYDGTVFTFTAPTANDKVVINTGTNTGQTWKYSASVWAQVTSSALSVYNWALSSSYSATNLVVYNSLLYQANANIPANTPFVLGSTGATFKLVGSSGTTSSTQFDPSYLLFGDF